MAKKSMIARDVKRLKTVTRFAAKRAELKEIIRSPKSSDAARLEAIDKLKKLPRDAGPTRMRNRCSITGRSRGVYSKFGLGRNKLREQTMEGNIPGLRKASW
jgi:small subunit ribosomal protein S14